jgi:hypothetical protein
MYMKTTFHCTSAEGRPHNVRFKRVPVNFVWLSIWVYVNIFRQRCIIQPSLYSKVITRFVNPFIYPRASSSDCSKQTLQNVSRKAHKILMAWSISIPGKNRNFTLWRFLMITFAFRPAPCTGCAVKTGVCPAPDIGVTSSWVCPVPYTGGTAGFPCKWRVHKCTAGR